MLRKNLFRFHLIEIQRASQPRETAQSVPECSISDFRLHSVSLQNFQVISSENQTKE